MTTLILTIIGSLLGIAGTYLSYRLDPKQQIYSQLDQLAKQKIILERQRDEALQANNTDNLTLAGNALFKLQQDQAGLFQRLKVINGGK